jgi:ABC-type spermidine/putrescine transport system permease subunit I
VGSFSVFHWVIVLVFCAVIGFPVARILQRTGHSPWWVLLAFVPFLNWAALWVFAYSPWPAIAEQARVNPDEERRLNL